MNYLNLNEQIAPYLCWSSALLICLYMLFISITTCAICERNTNHGTFNQIEVLCSFYFTVSFSC
jgi:hypothetical protein